MTIPNDTFLREILASTLVIKSLHTNRLEVQKKGVRIGLIIQNRINCCASDLRSCIGVYVPVLVILKLLKSFLRVI